MDNIPSGWTVLTVDESIFVYETVVRTVWAPKGSKPTVFITGSHKKTFVFGALSIDQQQMFRQHKQMDGRTFIIFLKELKRKFKKFILFYDQAPQHTAKVVEDFLDRNKESILPMLLPRYSPELNVVEECWRQAGNKVGTVYHHTFDLFTTHLTKYLRTTRFKLDMVKYLCRTL